MHISLSERLLFINAVIVTQHNQGWPIMGINAPIDNSKKHNINKNNNLIIMIKDV